MKDNLDESSDVEHPSITLRRSAMDYLARREHSFQELLQKLANKYPEHSTEELIIPAVLRLRKENLQSDQRFTESYVHHRCNAGFGPLKIEYELKQKGVDSQLIETYLYSDKTDWQHMCYQALIKKFPNTIGKEVKPERGSWENSKEQQRKQRFLYQRGFNADTITTALRATPS